MVLGSASIQIVIATNDLAEAIQAVSNISIIMVQSPLESGMGLPYLPKIPSGLLCWSCLLSIFVGLFKSGDIDPQTNALKCLFIHYHTAFRTFFLFFSFIESGQGPSPKHPLSRPSWDRTASLVACQSWRVTAMLYP
jgi:hypothetical protein